MGGAGYLDNARRLVTGRNWKRNGGHREWQMPVIVFHPGVEAIRGNFPDELIRDKSIHCFRLETQSFVSRESLQIFCRKKKQFSFSAKRRYGKAACSSRPPTMMWSMSSSFPSAHRFFLFSSVAAEVGAKRGEERKYTGSTFVDFWSSSTHLSLTLNTHALTRSRHYFPLSLSSKFSAITWTSHWKKK